MSLPSETLFTKYYRNFSCAQLQSISVKLNKLLRIIYELLGPIDAAKYLQMRCKLIDLEFARRWAMFNKKEA